MAVASNPASTLYDATYAFCVYLERPANADAKGKERAQIAARFFPQASTVSGPQLQKWEGGGMSSTTLALTGSVAALLLTVIWVYKDKIRARFGG
jgi:hypothetical protein